MSAGVGRFVWVRSLRGPIPEKWPDDMPVGGAVGKDVLQSYELGPDEFALKIAILEQRYPPPKAADPEPPREPDPSPSTPPPRPPATRGAKSAGMHRPWRQETEGRKLETNPKFKAVFSSSSPSFRPPLPRAGRFS